jgi:hypothetical protein
MSKVKRTKNKIKSKIESIKRITDDVKNNDDVFDSYLKDLPSFDGLFSTKLSTLSEKRKKNKENHNEIFSDLVEIIQSFLGYDRTIETKEKLTDKEKIRKITQDSISYTLGNVKSVLINNVNKILFTGDGICGTETLITTNSINIKPKEFDFLNVLTVDPTSNAGKIMYESEKTNTQKIKMNKKFYDVFDGSDYDFVTKSGNTLFNISWNGSNEEYNINDLISTDGITIYDFILDYYSNIDFIDISGVTKTAMLLTLKGDGSEPPLFDLGLNNLQRLNRKIFAKCGNQNNQINKTPLTEINENDDNGFEDYFDFDNVDETDLDEEKSRYEKVLKFNDCGNISVPINPNNIEDFVYLADNKNLSDVISDILLHTAGNVYEQSGQSQPLDMFHISLLNKFILNLPKALIGLVLSPKFLFPIILSYKLINNTIDDVKIIMKKLSKLFANLISEIYWLFIAEFWRLVKPELEIFLKKLIAKIIKNKFRRYKVLITTLIAFITNLLRTKLNNCESLYDLISNTIDIALKGGSSNLPINAKLLSLSDFKSGYSPDRAYMNVVQRMENAGISMGPIFGEPNKLNDLVKSIIDGHIDEQDSNSYVEVGNKFFTINAGPVQIPFPPGMIKATGHIR